MNLARATSIHVLVCLFIGMLIPAFPLSAFPIPDSVVRAKGFEKAQEQAEREGKCLILVMTNSSSDNLKERSLRLFKALEAVGTVVLLDTKDYSTQEKRDPIFEKIFLYALQAFGTPDMTKGSPSGFWVPKAVATTPDTGGILATLTPTQAEERDLGKFRGDISAWQAGKRVPDYGDGVEIDWPMENGAKWQAAFVSLKGDILTVRANGNDIPTSVEKFKAQSVNYARFLRQRARKPETWTSQEGKTIEATFVELRGDQINLKLADGKLSTIPLVRLSEASQKRARELAESE